MESLPVETLEKILSFVQDKDTLRSCRLVSHRWNAVTTRFLRRCVSTTKDMDQLLKLYRKFEGFRYRNICFRHLNNRATEAAQRLLRMCAASIQDVRVVVACLSARDFRKGLDSLDSRVLPNVRALSIEGVLDLRHVLKHLRAPPLLSLRNLTSLRLTFFYYEKSFGKIAAAVVEAAPNLKLFDATLNLNPMRHRVDVEPFWPFSERFRAIPTFLLRLRVSSYENFTESVSEVLGKLQEWRNVRLTELVLCGGVDRALMPQVKGLMQRVLAHAAGDLKRLTLDARPRDDIDLGIDLPHLDALETLEVHNYGAALLLNPIQGHRFRALHQVTLHCSEEHGRRFNGTVFESVKVFRFHEERWGGRWPGTFTPWATVFPNLEKFVLVNGAHFERTPEGLRAEYEEAFGTSECRLSLSWVEFLLSHMRFSSLKSVAWGLSSLELEHKRFQPIYPEPSRVVGNALSGFDDLEMVVRGADAAQDEEAYWAQMEALRRPYIVQYEGLQSFLFDYPIDDDFAIGVLLRMKPLELLTICSEHLSRDVLEKLAAHHKLICSASLGFIEKDFVYSSVRLF